MKKYFLCLSLFLIAQWSLGQNVKQLFAEFSKTANAECVNLNNLETSFLKPFVKSNDIPGLKNMKAVQVIDLSNCPEEVKQRFAEKVKSLNDKEYETMVSSNENGERVRVLVKIKKEEISELVVITTGDDASLVKIKGSFKQSDLAKYTTNQ